MRLGFFRGVYIADSPPGCSKICTERNALNPPNYELPPNSYLVFQPYLIPIDEVEDEKADGEEDGRESIDAVPIVHHVTAAARAAATQATEEAIAPRTTTQRRE